MANNTKNTLQMENKLSFEHLYAEMIIKIVNTNDWHTLFIHSLLIIKIFNTFHKSELVFLTNPNNCASRKLESTILTLELIFHFDLYEIYQLQFHIILHPKHFWSTI